MPMKKILFIHHAAGWGGAPNCLVNLIRNLDSSKYESKVLLIKNSVVAEKLTEYGINFEVAESEFYKKYYQFFAHSEAGYIKWFHFYSFIKLSVFWVLSRYFYAPRELARHQFDFVHLNSSVLTDWLAPAKKKGKVIIHIREPFRKGKWDFLHPFFKFQMIKYADQIIAISKDNARRISIPSKTAIIYDFCDVPKEESLSSSYDSKLFLYLGGSSTSKGFYLLVDALDYLDKDVKVLFGGQLVTSECPRNILHKILFVLSKAKKRNASIKKIQNHPNAIAIGLIDNVDEYLKKVCCLVSPFSVPHFSCPVIEAHIHKKPAIGSDVEGMDEIIAHEKNGLIVPKNNPKALAAAINRVISDSGQAKIFGQDGYNIAIRKFTPQNIKMFEKVYDSLLFDN